MLSIEKIRENDRRLIRRTRDVLYDAFLEERILHPERYADLSYEQFEKLFVGYIILTTKELADRFNIPAEEFMERE